MRKPKQTLSLLNFRVPNTTKIQFQRACQDRHLMMTSVLNQFIHDFIHKHHHEKNLDFEGLPSFYRT